MSKYIENERFIEVYKLLINDRKIKLNQPEPPNRKQFFLKYQS